MRVKEAKQLCASGTTEEIVAAYRKLKAKQRSMSLAQLIAACRVTDKLAAELKRRGVNPKETT